MLRRIVMHEVAWRHQFWSSSSKYLRSATPIASLPSLPPAILQQHRYANLEFQCSCYCVCELLVSRASSRCYEALEWERMADEARVSQQRGGSV